MLCGRWTLLSCMPVCYRRAVTKCKNIRISLNLQIIVDNYLQVQRYPDVFALGDCASITDRHTGKQCPPTAQHAIREGKVAAKNLISRITTEKKRQEQRG